MQEWLNNNDILMQSTHNEDKSVIAERVTKTLKHTIILTIVLLIKNLLMLIILLWLKKLRKS